MDRHDDEHVGGDQPAGDDLEQLRRLGELHRDGILTDEEFAAKKAALLGTGTPPARPRRRLRERISRRTAVVAGVLLLLVAGGAGALLKVQHDDDVRDKREARERRERAAERQRAADDAAAKARQEAEEEQELEDELSVALRKDLVQSLRTSVTNDFQKRVTAGELDGPILGTSCDPISGGVEDLEETTGKFECLVATERTSASGRRGYPVTATINYTKGSYTWQLSG